MEATAAGVIRSVSPQDPSDVVGEWPDDGSAAVDRAVAAAAAAHAEWRFLPALERCRLLGIAADRMAANSDALADLMVREVGKPIGESRAEAARAVAILRYYAQATLDADGETYPSADGRSWLFARRRPRGVVALITPWNFPLAIPVWKLAPALAWGNTVVFKPSRAAAALGVRIGEVLALPPGVFQVVLGGSETGHRLTTHPTVRAISFTGSIEAGNEVAGNAARGGIAFQGELGGSNAAVILPDADVAAAASAIAAAAMGYAGQKCTATSRVIVVGDNRDFVDAFVAAVEGLAVGDPAHDGTVVGPVIDGSARDRVLSVAAEAAASGAKVLTGGHSVGERGWFVAPTLVADVSPDSELAHNEVFGPICSISSVSTVADAVRLANGTRYGLVGSVWTNDLSRAMRIAEDLDAGLIRVNAPTTGVDYWAPFGGTKSSSIGPREQGRAAREFYTTYATMTVAPTR